MGDKAPPLQDVIREKLIQEGHMTSLDLAKSIYDSCPEIKKKYGNFKTLTRNIQHSLCTVMAFEFAENSKKGNRKFWSYNPEKPLKRRPIPKKKKSEPVTVDVPPPPDPEHLFLWYDKEHILFGK